MSTYLVGFVFNEFFDVNEETVNSVFCLVKIPVGKKELGRLGLFVTGIVLRYYKEHFGVE